jgi:hypothetical protein
MSAKVMPVLFLLTFGCVNSLAQGPTVPAAHQFKHQVDVTVPGQAHPYSAPTGANLVYYGGRIVSNPIYYRVKWGSSVANYGNLDLYYSDMGALEFNDLLSQYSTTGHNPGTNQTIGPGSFGGTFTITPSISNTSIDDSQIQAELIRQIKAGHLPVPTADLAGNNNAIYSIEFPPGDTITLNGASSCQSGGFCGYHSTVAASSGVPEFYYAVLPDEGPTSGCNTGCGTAATTFQNMTSVLSHEITETITDAEVGLSTGVAAPLAWYDATNGEIGDICNAEQGTMTGPSGTTYTLQKEWSNNYTECLIPSQVFQIITFNPLPNRKLGYPPFLLTATSNTGFPISYTGGTAGVCSVTTGGQVTMLGAGQCSVTANQAGGVFGGTTYAAAGFVNQKFLITNTSESPISVSPNSGNGVGQVFTATYRDTGGASNIQVVYLDFGAVGFATHDCIALYVPGVNQLYLFSDDNNSSLGPITLGAGGSVSNNQCTLSGGAANATQNATDLTVPFNITFKSGYGGQKHIFVLSQDYAGEQSGFGVPADMGTWTPASSTPSVVPANITGGGNGPFTFSIQYSDTGGANDLQAVYLQFASVAEAVHNCKVVYVPGPNQLYLFSDSDPNSALGPIAEGAGGGSLSNSQCTLTSGTTAATAGGNTLTVPFNIEFKSGYGGKKTIWALAQNYAGVQSNGGVPNSIGTWTPAASTPSAVSVTPNSGTGLSQVFTAAYSDTGGANDLQAVYLSFGSSFLAANSCNVGYQPGNNQLLLFSDDNSTAATLGENGPGSVSNSQCTLSGGNTAATQSGINQTVPFTITFKSGFTGAKTVFGLAQTYAGTQSGSPAGTPTNLGTWTP